MEESVAIWDVAHGDPISTLRDDRTEGSYTRPMVSSPDEVFVLMLLAGC